MKPKIILCLALVLGFMLAGCALRREPSSVRSSTARKEDRDVSVLNDPSTTAGSLEAALPQLGRAAAPVLLKTCHPVVSTLQALSEIQKVADRPIVAVAEYKDWFWFATHVARDSETKTISAFIGGYAVQKGGRAVLKWGVW